MPSSHSSSPLWQRDSPSPPHNNDRSRSGSESKWEKWDDGGKGWYTNQWTGNQPGGEWWEEKGGHRQWQTWSEEEEEEESWKETEWQPKKKYERMSGSHKERNRLAAIERVQGKASGYDRQVQRLSAIGEARFKRMQVRKGRRDQALLMLLCVL